MIWIEVVVLLACIAAGARLGGIAIGTAAGMGLFVFVFFFGLPPGGPPGAVIGMIIAVITALAALEAAGGLNYLVAVGEKIMRRRPQAITFVAPLVTYALVFGSGTTHVIYALLPIIAEVARKADIRPERPLSISVIAGFQGVLASPISAATLWRAAYAPIPRSSAEIVSVSARLTARRTAFSSSRTLPGQSCLSNASLASLDRRKGPRSPGVSLRRK